MTESERRLRQQEEEWECSGRPARWWITPRGKPARRPNVMLTVAADSGRRVRVEFDEDPPRTVGPIGRAAPPPVPTLEYAFAHLLQAMRHPTAGGGSPRRPSVISTDNSDLADALAPRLAELEVRCQYRPSLPAVDKLMGQLADHYDQRGPIPGLLTLPGVTVPLVTHLCRLAAEFYGLAPWRYLSDREPFEIRYPSDGPPRYAIVMGSGGVVFGLAGYDELNQMRLLLANPEAEDILRANNQPMLFFDRPITMAFDDLETMEKYGLALAGERAYPSFGRTTREGTISTPRASDVFWFEGLLAGLIGYVRDHMRFLNGKIVPADLTFSVETLSGERKVNLRVPVR